MNKFKTKLKLVKGTRFISFLFIGCSILIAAGFLFAANMYYNIDTGEVVTEQIQRVTGNLRATAGLIVGGTSTQDPASGVSLEVAGDDVLLSAASQVLRFSGGTSYYVGFKAPTDITTTTVYTWPSTYPSASNYLLKSSDAGILEWADPGAMGLGTITAVGNVTSGDAFTAGGTQGTSLWFYDPQGRGQLTITDLTAPRTYTLPDLTGVVALQEAATLTSGGIVFADGLGRLVQDSYFNYSTSTRTLVLGSSGTDGKIRFYGSTAGYTEFQAAASGNNITYTWPAAVSAGNVLTTDGDGNLTWETVEGVGGISGSGSAGQVSFWTGDSTLGGSNNLFWATSTNRLGIGTASPDYDLDVVGTARLSTSLITPLVQSAGILTLESLGGNIVLNPSTNIVELGTDTHIQTASGFEIGKAGTEILREMIPILGFDLPVQTATTSHVKISRTIQDYPFSATTTGTERAHKFVIRYTDDLTTGTTSWRVVGAVSGQIDSFALPFSNNSALDSGHATTTAEVTIPLDSENWWLEVNPGGDTIRIFQIFLAAYDVVQ